MAHHTSANDDGIALQAGALRLAVRPDLGASLAGLWHQGIPVLRSTEPNLLRGPRQSACFPLVPYSNRLGHRRFTWRGRAYTTEPNFDGSPHSLHGVGWLRTWHVMSHEVVQETSRLTLRYRHTPDGHWPFAFDAEQRITLTPHAMQLDLALRNTDMQEQPAGLGWHPYFPRHANSHLKMEVTTRWEVDALQLPTYPTVQSGIDTGLGDLDLDHCFSGWRGAAQIRDERFLLRLSSSLPYVVVFTPPAQAHFCVEPVSHVNNAINKEDPALQGMVALAPGEVLAASLTLQVAVLQ